MNPDMFIWTEKYRPSVIADCILPDTIKTKAEGYVKAGRIPTMIFTGGAGVGKTTLAKCLANEVGADFMVVNASMENGIDNVRTKILNFASTVSFSSSKKITLLDEADYLSHNAQASLRNFIEQFSENHSLILTCNFKNKLIEPLHSRAQIIDFKIPSAEKAQVASQFFKRVVQILTTEGIEFDKRVIAEVVNHYFPDFRRCLNELQKFSINGSIDSSILAEFSDETFKELINILKARKFNDMRKWVAKHSDIDPASLFRMFYNSAGERMEPKSLPNLVIMLAEYQYKSAFVVDQEINTAAFLTQLMMSGEVIWK